MAVYLVRRGALRIHRKPGRQYFRLQPDFGCNSESQFHHLGLGFRAQADTFNARNGDQQVHQALGEFGIFQKVLLLALDDDGEKGHGLADDGLIVGGGSDLANGDVGLVVGGKGQARVRRGTAGFIVQDGGELLQARAQDLGGILVSGEVGGRAPDLQQLVVLALEALEALLGVVGSCSLALLSRRRQRRAGYKAGPLGGA